MKTIKKLFNMVLAVVMLVLQIVPTTLVSAEEVTTTETGTITITGTLTGETYSVYKILDLETYVYDDETKEGQFIYRVEENWVNFVKGDVASQYLELTDGDSVTTNDATLDTSKVYVVWKSGVDETTGAAALASAAIEYAETNSIGATTSKQATGDEVTFTGLDLGYYLVDSSLGAICGLTTTKPEATVIEKNDIPTVSKEVKEDSTGTFGTENDATIGDTVEYRAIINVVAGTENYVLYDLLSDGLTLDTTSFKVLINNEGTAITESENTFQVIYPTTAEDKALYTFKVEFDNEYIATLEAGTKIYVYYNAVLDEDAIIAGNGNLNEVWLTYGNAQKTDKDTTVTYTYSFDLVKTNKENEVLYGAEFTLYDKDGNAIEVVWDTTKNAYRVASKTETGTTTIAVTEETTVDGILTIVGLDSDSYSLEETKAPVGYNKLNRRITFTIEGDSLNNADTEETIKEQTITTTNENGETEETIKTTTVIKYTDGGVQVINYTGAQLPETGGIGTILFITIGSLLVLGFGVLLVTKLRISKIEA